MKGYLWRWIYTSRKGKKYVDWCVIDKAYDMRSKDDIKIPISIPNSLHALKFCSRCIYLEGDNILDKKDPKRWRDPEDRWTTDLTEKERVWVRKMLLIVEAYELLHN
jgi:hypothetical protein